MKCFLMNRNDIVVEFNINKTELKKTKMSKSPIQITEDYMAYKLPVSVLYADDRDIALWNFLISRIAPFQRIQNLLKASNTNKMTFGMLFLNMVEAHMLSLSDQYWVTRINSPSNWDNINFFNNGFSSAIGNASFGYEKWSDIINTNDLYFSPDLTTIGNLTKAWRQEIIDNRPINILLKSGKPMNYQEPFNEAFTSEIAKHICKCKYVKYSISYVGNFPVSLCRSFLNDRVMLVSAYDVCSIKKREYGMTLYEHLDWCCKMLNIKNYKKDLHSMLLFDYFIGNRDRHLGNFGFLYDVVAEKFLGMAPIYDNGNSMWFEERTELIYESKNDSAKPFGINFEDNLACVSNVSDLLKNNVFFLLKQDLSNGLMNYIFHEYGDQKRITELTRKMHQHLIDVEQTLEQELEKGDRKKSKKNNLPEKRGSIAQDKDNQQYTLDDM